MEAEDLTCGRHHFRFGQNWADYSGCIDERRVDAAVADMARLLGVSSLRGTRVLDIGCGSGIHSVAALRLGADSVLAVDIDPDSVATARVVLATHGHAGSWRVERASVFDLGSRMDGGHDVVYSWGVLHHTGDLSKALRAASEAVTPGGVLAVALYRPIWTEWLWKMEKRWYRRASPAAQRRVQALYRHSFNAGLLASGRSPSTYHSEYAARRGMSFDHDAHDWLGGWPYESIGAEALVSSMDRRGLVLERRFVRPRGIRELLGEVFGSGCDEFVFRRPDARPVAPGSAAADGVGSEGGR